MNGLLTVLIDGGGEAGGLCILRGCMPTKMLLYSAEVLHHARHLPQFGVSADHIGFDFAKVMARKNAFVDDLAGGRRAELANGGFTFLQAHARFVDPHTVEVGHHGLLTAANFVIATGSSVSPPELSHLDTVGYLTSDDALMLTQLPKSLIVLGGGPVGVEFAQFFARFGVRVTLLQRSAQLLSNFDTDVAMEAEKTLRRDGVEIFTNTELTDAVGDAALKTVRFVHGGQLAAASATQILLALGRTPNTASLDLAKAGVATKGGHLVANEFMQTSASHIYAAGDCTGPHEVVHLAVMQGELAAHNIAHPEAMRQLDERLLLSVTFIEPQVACVGLSVKAALTRGVSHLAADYRFSDHGKAQIMGTTEGLVKLLADPQSGEILGGACVGPLGGELIHEIVAAIAKRMTVHELAALPHYHPTLAEIWTYPAEALADQIPSPRHGSLGTQVGPTRQANDG